MPIRKGEPWGVEVARPDDLGFAASDAELARMLADGGHAPLAPAGGDLHRSLGAPEPRDRMQRVEIDLLRVVADGATHVAVAHVVARRSWWRGAIVAVMNVDHLGAWNVAPRAHPNDGFVDVVEVDGTMGVRQRLQARSRLPLGTHVPHPAITTRRVRGASWRFERPMRLWVDGVACGSVTDLTVELDVDAATVHI